MTDESFCKGQELTDFFGIKKLWAEAGESVGKASSE